MDIAELMARCKLARSKTEARKAILNHGILIDDSTLVTDPFAQLFVKDGKWLLAERGKWQ